MEGPKLNSPQKSVVNTEDAQANICEGKCFTDDFEYVVEQGDLRFDGDFAYGAALSHAPNPCLYIEGLGVLGLPLNEFEAQRIIKHSDSAQAPYGHGSSTSVAKTGAEGTWDIEATRVTFQNPAWKPFLTELVKKACKLLDAVFSTNLPVCELHKLSLCMPGTFSYSTEKIGFATLVIILPSSYAGGQVQISLARSTETFDFAPHSSTNICMLSWYNEVVPEVKPITSGYRLALIYDLIPTSSAVPRLPKVHTAISNLRVVLRRWSEGHYPNDSRLNIIACLLAHEYDEVTLTMDDLKGEDAHKISHIRPVAEELGYVIGLAVLSYSIFGLRSYDDERCECDDDDDDAEMSEVLATRISIDNLVDLDGSPIVKFTKLKLDKKNLIPDNPFEDEKPDESEFHQCYRTHCTVPVDSDSDADSDTAEEYNLEHVYRRPVLFLFHKDQELSLLLSAGGVSYALQRIRDNISQGKTPENVSMVEYILQKASGRKHEDILSAVANYVTQWKDVKIWKQVIETACEDDENDNMFALFGDEKVFEACRTFHLDEIQTTLDKILDHGATLKNQVDLIKFLRAQSSEENVSRWCSKRMSHILASLNELRPKVDDVPALLSIVTEKGLSFIPDVILPQLGLRTGITSFDFWVAFIAMLYDQKASITGPSRSDVVQHSQKRDGNSFEHVIGLVIRQSYYHAPVTSTTIRYTIDSMISQLLKLVELCITHGDVGASLALFRVVVMSGGSPEDKFRDFYRLLMPQLRQLLEKHAVDICSPPFQELMQFLIGQCLSAALGAKPSPSASTMRKIGCGCAGCNTLDAFLISDSTSKEFRGVNRLGKHLEEQMLGASDIVNSHRSHTSGKKPFTLVVNKNPEGHKATQWNLRQKAAEDFLSSIGNAGVIAKIMGIRYAHVQKALAGVEVFVMNPSAWSQVQGPGIPNVIAPQNTFSTGLASRYTDARAKSMPVTRSISRNDSATLKRKRDGEP